MHEWSLCIVVGGGGRDISGLHALWVSGRTDIMRMLKRGHRLGTCFVGNWSY